MPGVHWLINGFNFETISGQILFAKLWAPPKGYFFLTFFIPWQSDFLPTTLGFDLDSLVLFLFFFNSCSSFVPKRFWSLFSLLGWVFLLSELEYSRFWLEGLKWFLFFPTSLSLVDFLFLWIMVSSSNLRALAKEDDWILCLIQKESSSSSKSSLLEH